VALLEGEELSVAELQEITKLAQSRISTHLGLLSRRPTSPARLPAWWRSGRDPARPWPRRPSGREFTQLAIRAAASCLNMRATRSTSGACSASASSRRRSISTRSRAVSTAVRPGPFVAAFGHLLLRMLPPLVVADLGSGEGLIAELIARRCQHVIAVDNSEKMVEFGARKAKKNGLKNLEFRLGDLEQPPIDPESVDLVILSQACTREDPAKAIAAAHRILKPGGQLLLLDLVKHGFAPGPSCTATAGSALPRPISTAGWKPPASGTSSSASSRVKSNRPISKRCWRQPRNRPVVPAGQHFEGWQNPPLFLGSRYEFLLSTRALAALFCATAGSVHAAQFVYDGTATPDSATFGPTFTTILFGDTFWNTDGNVLTMHTATGEGIWFGAGYSYGDNPSFSLSNNSTGNGLTLRARLSSDATDWNAYIADGSKFPVSTSTALPSNIRPPPNR
jgi:ArsR family transcriptional regulator